MSRKLKQLILILGDTALLYLSLYLSLAIRYGVRFEPFRFWRNVPLFSAVYAIWLVVFFIIGLYSIRTAWNYESTLRKFLRSMLVNVAVAIAFFYLVPYFQLTPKTTLLFDVAIFFVLFGIWRFVFSRTIRALGTTISLVLIGGNKVSLELAQEIVDHPELGYKLVGFFNLESGYIPQWLKRSGALIGDKFFQFRRLIKSREVDSVVISNDTYHKIFGELYRLIPTGIKIYNLSSFWEDMDRSIPTSEADKVWFLENLRGVKKRIYEARKRWLDAMFAAVLGVPALLIYLPIALGIKLTDGGPVLYRQKRVGKDGKLFEVIKFRTMIPNAERRKARWAKKNDHRVTKFGRFLRSTRLDEVPQLINVFRGEMSFIGPRPERPEFVQDLKKQIPHYDLRQLIRPGITGWAQVNYPYGASEEDAGKKLRYDLYYLKHRSLLLDTEILLKTFEVVLSAKGR
jgi:exopolysaccharide biosynthesis polyprenyl glycosylphosphotransferase